MSKTKFRDDTLFTGGLTAGDFNDYATFDTTGHLSLAGTARVRRDIWIPASEFLVSATSGSMESASILINVSTSLFNGVAGSMASIKVVQPAVDITASATTAFASFGIPRDAATTGSITATVEWTSHDSMATAGSVFVIKAGLAYLAGSAVARTAASTGASPAYNYTASGTWHSTSLGNLPSFGANDTTGILVLRHDQTDTDDTAGSGIAFAGVRLTYTANKLGASSSE